MSSLLCPFSWKPCYRMIQTTKLKDDFPFQVAILLIYYYITSCRKPRKVSYILVCWIIEHTKHSIPLHRGLAGYSPDLVIAYYPSENIIITYRFIAKALNEVTATQRDRNLMCRCPLGLGLGGILGRFFLERYMNILAYDSMMNWVNVQINRSIQNKRNNNKP